MSDTSLPIAGPSLPEVHGVQADVEAGKIYFFEALSPDMTTRLISTLDHLATFEYDALMLVCGSSGGSTACMFALMDHIAQLSVPVDLHALGALASASTGLLSVCRTRVAGPHCEVLLHAMTMDIEGGCWDHNEFHRAAQRLHDDCSYWAEALARRSGLDVAYLLDIALGVHHEVRIRGHRLVEMGLVDSIIPSLPPPAGPASSSATSRSGGLTSKIVRTSTGRRITPPHNDTLI